MKICVVCNEETHENHGNDFNAGFVCYGCVNDAIDEKINAGYNEAQWLQDNEEEIKSVLGCFVGGVEEEIPEGTDPRIIKEALAQYNALDI